jgi:hypothetical protein
MNLSDHISDYIGFLAEQFNHRQIIKTLSAGSARFWHKPNKGFINKQFYVVSHFL